MGGCAGRHLGGPRSPPGGCKKLEETRREVLQRFPPSRRPACRYIILLTICPKTVKAAGFPRNDAEARQRKRQLLIPGGYTLLRWKFFTDDLFLIRLSFPFTIETVSRLLEYFAIRSEEQLWINRWKSIKNKIHASFIRLRNDYNMCTCVRYFTIRTLDENNKRYANGITNLMELNGTALICFNKFNKS